MAGMAVLMCLQVLMGCTARQDGLVHDAEATVPASEVPQEDAAGLATRAEGLLKAGRRDEALYYFVRLLEAEPDNARALAAIGVIHLERNHLDLARLALEMSLEKQPGQALVYEGLGVVAFRQQRYGDADGLFRKALAEDPHLWRSENALGLMADQQGRFDEAEVHYRQALSESPGNRQVMTNLGYSKYLKGDFAGAIQETDRVLHARPDDEPALMNKALYLLAQDRGKEALDLFRGVVSQPDAYNNIGYFFLMNRNYATAKACFEKAIAIAPAYHALANENLARVMEMMRVDEEGKAGNAGNGDSPC